MNRSLLLCFAAAFAATTAFAQTPVIGAIAHAATFSPVGIPNSVIPQGGFFAIFGTSMGPAAGAQPTGAFPTSLSGVSVSVVSGGTTVAPLLYFVSAGQINAVLPSNTPAGSATVTVTYNGSTSAATSFVIASSNFGFFTRNGGGTGPADVQNYSQNYALNSLTNTAKPGDTLILYGSGLGPSVNNEDELPSGLAGGYGIDLRGPDNLDFHLYLGGLEVPALYVGRSQYAGLDQINVTIPANTATGCFVPLIIRIGSVVSNSPSVSIDANGQTCSDPFGLTPAQITQAETGSLHVGSILLTRLALNLGLPVPLTEDDVDARFYDFTASSFYSDPANNADFLALSSFGSCLISNCSNTYTCVPSAQGLPVGKLDAGSALTVSGTGVSSVSAPQGSNGNYDAHLGSNPLQIGKYPLANYLQPGNYTVAGTGVGDVKAFSAAISVPAPLIWSSPQFSTQQETVSRANPLTVNWSGGGSKDYVLISVGSAYLIPNSNPANYNSATITCLQPASLGTYTLPSWLLEALPPSSTVQIVQGINAPGAAVLMGIYSPSVTFTAPGLDVALANSIVSSGQNVTLQ